MRTAIVIFTLLFSIQALAAPKQLICPKYKNDVEVPRCPDGSQDTARIIRLDTNDFNTPGAKAELELLRCEGSAYLPKVEIHQADLTVTSSAITVSYTDLSGASAFSVDRKTLKGRHAGQVTDDYWLCTIEDIDASANQI